MTIFILMSLILKFSLRLYVMCLIQVIAPSDEIRAKQEKNILVNGKTEATFEYTTSLRIQSEGRSGGHVISATTLKKRIEFHVNIVENVSKKAITQLEFAIK